MRRIVRARSGLESMLSPPGICVIIESNVTAHCLYFTFSPCNKKGPLQIRRAWGFVQISLFGTHRTIDHVLGVANRKAAGFLTRWEFLECSQEFRRVVSRCQH